MKLNDFLDVVDTDDMIEVYTKDGTTRPREVKLVNAFYVAEVDLELPDTTNELEAYLDREVTGVTVVRLDRRGGDEIVAMRVYVEHKEGDENVQDEEEAQIAGTEDGQVKKELEGPARSAVCEHLGFAHSILCDLVTLVGSSATDTVSEESVEALIRTAIDRVQRAGKAIGFKLGEVE